MAAKRNFIAYRRDLKAPSRTLRRDPTPAERKLWYEFLRTVPERFSRQKPLGRYIADFYCSSRRLVIELDGDSHFDTHGQRYDELRTADLHAEGLRVIRFTNTEVIQNFDAVCEQILAALRDKP